MKRLLLVVTLASGCTNSDTPDSNFIFDNGDMSAGGKGDLGDMAMVTTGDGGPASKLDLLVFDSTGPTITFNSPTASAFVSGILALDVSITDGSGVDETSIKVVIGASNGNGGGTEIKVERVPNSDNFRGVIDTRTLDQAFVLPVISVTATDLSKGKNQSSVAETVIIDNVGPAIDLDPPDLHIHKFGVNTNTCSRGFDPVGRFATNDGDTVLQLQNLRVRVEDVGNYAPGLRHEYPSLVRKTSVKLYVAPAAYGPLVADADFADGICDSINPDLLPLGGKNQVATEVDLAPLSPVGEADFTQILDPNTGLALTDPVCQSLGLPIGDPAVLLPPKTVCGNDLTIHIGYLFTLLEPAIWTIPLVVAAPSRDCEGFQFDAENSMIPEGPLCVAVVAEDNAGNRSVSPPLRICYDKGGDLCGNFKGHDSDPANLPTCVKNGCSPGYRSNIADITGSYLRPMFPDPVLEIDQ